MAVRTDVLAAANHGAGTFSDYIVAAQTTAILKDLRISAASTAAGTAFFSVVRASGVVIDILRMNLPAGGAIQVASLVGMFIAMEPGDHTRLVAAGVGVSVSAWWSGAKLAGLAP